MIKSADTGSDPFQTMGHIAQQVGDKRFLAQLSGVKSLAEKGDWRGVTLGCKMLYKIATEGGFIEQVEPVLRPFFNLAVERFEKSRAAMVKLYSRMASSARMLRQIERLASLMDCSV